MVLPTTWKSILLVLVPMQPLDVIVFTALVKAQHIASYPDIEPSKVTRDKLSEVSKLSLS